MEALSVICGQCQHHIAPKNCFSFELSFTDPSKSTLRLIDPTSKKTVLNAISMRLPPYTIELTTTLPRDKHVRTILAVFDPPKA